MIFFKLKSKLDEVIMLDELGCLRDTCENCPFQNKPCLPDDIRKKRIQLTNSLEMTKRKLGII